MSDQNEDLNSHLERAFRQRERNNAPADEPPEQTHEIIRATPVNTELSTGPEETAEVVQEEKMGLISRLRLRNAESAHELQKARTTYETEIELIRHKADAAIRESRAFWDAKSVEVAETIKTYVQSTVRALEIDRLDSRNADLQRAYQSAAEALEKARASSLPEVMKDRLIQDILNNFENTLQRIQEDTIVSRYDLD
ncbi:MAG TPA: hypothetical protein DCG12_06505 [Planctomycetaceae bacterium]|nr:hypothetical protein [Planctomycetaceae bacterium]